LKGTRTPHPADGISSQHSPSHSARDKPKVILPTASVSGYACQEDHATINTISSGIAEQNPQS